MKSVVYLQAKRPPPRRRTPYAAEAAGASSDSSALQHRPQPCLLFDFSDNLVSPDQFLPPLQKLLPSLVFLTDTTDVVIGNVSARDDIATPNVFVREEIKDEKYEQKTNWVKGSLFFPL